MIFLDDKTSLNQVRIHLIYHIIEVYRVEESTYCVVPVYTGWLDLDNVNNFLNCLSLQLDFDF